MRDIREDLKERIEWLDNRIVSEAQMIEVMAANIKDYKLRRDAIQRVYAIEEKIYTSAGEPATVRAAGASPKGQAAKTKALPQGAPAAVHVVTIPTAGEPLKELQNLPVTAATTVEAGDSGASPGKAREPQPATAVDGGRLGLSPGDEVAEVVAPAIAELVAPKPGPLPPNIKIEPKTAIADHDLQAKSKEISAIAQAIVKAPKVTLPKTPPASHRPPAKVVSPLRSFAHSTTAGERSLVGRSSPAEKPRESTKVLIPDVQRPEIKFVYFRQTVKLPGPRHKAVVEKLRDCMGKGVLPYDVLISAAGISNAGGKAYLATIVSDLRSMVEPLGLEIVAQEKMGFMMREASK